ncbi:MAG: TspO/MBR family protein [Paracoccaceae bacterium]|jgi:translocator protein
MNVLLFLVFLCAAAVAASTGSLFSPGDWYLSLSRPSWAPPSWAFPVVWTTLYILMAWAASRVASRQGAALALAFFSLQIALNTLWTPVFFGAHRIGAGLLVLGLLWLTVAAMSVAFWRLDRFAGLMILPYLAWLSVAASLNFWIWQNN